MRGFLFEDSFGVFLLVTVFLGGGASWLTGRAVAGTWRPPFQAALYALLLALVVRFIHYALFGGTLLSGYFYVVDAAVCLASAFLGYKVTRSRQMRRQYAWLVAGERPVPPDAGEKSPS